MPTGTLIEIPVYVFNGNKLGPTVLLQGGLHGDETNSIEIIRRMLENDYFKIERGCVIVVPLLSVFGFLHFSRDVHGKDVNRSFPGTKTGSLASRIAYFHMISKSPIKITKKSGSIYLNKKRWIRAKIAGLFNSFAHNGDKVVKGQIIGDITDTYGETSLKIKSPISGYIIAINYFPVINRGDAIFHLGVDN